MALSAQKDTVTQQWIRTFYILSNVILVFLGIGGLAVSVISMLDMLDDLTLLNHYQNVNVDVFLGSSVVLIVISLLGIFAGAKNSNSLTVTNAALLGSFLVSTTAYTISMGLLTDYTQEGDLYQLMKKDMKDYKYYNKTRYTIFTVVDTLQNKLSCCGLDGIDTWDKDNIPDSCCRNNKRNCILGSPYLQTNGCFEEFLRTARYYAWLIFSILISVGLIEIFTITVSSVQHNIVKNRKRAVEDLKIPKLQVHGENGIQKNEKEIKKLEKKKKLEEKKKNEQNRNIKKKQDTAEKEKEKENNDKEEKEKKEEAKEDKKTGHESVLLENIVINIC